MIECQIIEMLSYLGWEVKGATLEHLCWFWKAFPKLYPEKQFLIEFFQGAKSECQIIEMLSYLGWEVKGATVEYLCWFWKVFPENWFLT